MRLRREPREEHDHDNNEKKRDGTLRQFCVQQHSLYPPSPLPLSPSPSPIPVLSLIDSLLHLTPAVPFSLSPPHTPFSCSSLFIFSAFVAVVAPVQGSKQKHKTTQRNKKRICESIPLSFSLSFQPLQGLSLHTHIHYVSVLSHLFPAPASLPTVALASNTFHIYIFFSLPYRLLSFQVNGFTHPTGSQYERN